MGQGIHVGYLNPLPMARLHCFVAHELKERADFIEVIDGLLQSKEGRPLLQGLWKFSAPVKREVFADKQNTILPVAEIHQLVVDVLHIDLLPQDGEVPANNDYQNGIVRIFKQCLTNIILVKSESTR